MRYLEKWWMVGRAYIRCTAGDNITAGRKAEALLSYGRMCIENYNGANYEGEAEDLQKLPEGVLEHIMGW